MSGLGVEIGLLDLGFGIGGMDTALLRRQANKARFRQQQQQEILIHFAQGCTRSSIFDDLGLRLGPGCF